MLRDTLEFYEKRNTEFYQIESKYLSQMFANAEEANKIIHFIFTFHRSGHLFFSPAKQRCPCYAIAVLNTKECRMSPAYVLPRAKRLAYLACSFFP